MTQRFDILLKMFDQHTALAKWHEEQREKMTNYLYIFTAAIIGLVTTAKLTMYTIPSSVTLIALGVYGALFSLKHYERSRAHYRIKNTFLAEIERELAQARDAATTAPKALKDIVKHTDRRSRKSFRILGSQDFDADDVGDVEDCPRRSGLESFIAESDLHLFWAALPLLAALFGVIFLSAAAWFSLAPEPPARPIDVRIVQ